MKLLHFTQWTECYKTINMVKMTDVVFVYLQKAVQTIDHKKLFFQKNYSMGFSNHDINIFHATVLFIYPVKKPENQRLSNVFRGHRKRPVVWTGELALNITCITRQWSHHDNVRQQQWYLSVAFRWISIILHKLSISLCCRPEAY